MQLRVRFQRAWRPRDELLDQCPRHRWR
jgi:hypothetical protein